MTKGKKRMFRIVGLAVAFFLLCYAGWEVSQYIIHSRGTVVERPEGETETYTYSDYGFQYKVFDEKWSRESLGDSGWTINEKGDFLCCVCSVMAAVGKNGGSTPDKVNALLCELEGYDKDGDMKKDVLKAIAENVKYHSFINPGLKDDKVVKSTDDPDTAFDIVRVKKGGDFRWIVIKGIYGKDYWCMDPKEKEDTYLSDYGSRVYEWYTMGGLQDDVDINEQESVLAKIEEVEKRKRKVYVVVGLLIFLTISWTIGRKIDQYKKQNR